MSRITLDPKVHFGQPCVVGTRIPVHCVLELVQQGIAFAEISRKFYPELTDQDIKACVAYAPIPRFSSVPTNSNEF